MGRDLYDDRLKKGKKKFKKKSFRIIREKKLRKKLWWEVDTSTVWP